MDFVSIEDCYLAQKIAEYRQALAKVKEAEAQFDDVSTRLEGYCKSLGIEIIVK